MEANTTSDISQQSETSSQNGSTNVSNGDYELINPAVEVFGVGGDQLGAPIQIVKVSEEHHFELNLDALSAILLRDSIRDKPVVVVTFDGDFRKGKSFMLNSFLRYLQSGCDTTSDWLGDLQTPLKGFSWRGGSERDTTDILMWSEPFIVKLNDGKEVAIVLMDTQLALHSEYAELALDSFYISALSHMTSSIQVSNLMHNHNEREMEGRGPFLEIIADYGLIAYNYCFVDSVDIDSEYVDYLKTFVPEVLDLQDDILTQHWGRLVTGKQLMEFLKVYINVFAGEPMIEPKSLLEATANANNLTAVATVRDSYVSAMEEICGGEKPFLNPKTLETKHNELRNEMIDTFDKIPKMGGKMFSESYRRQLMIILDRVFEHFKAQNKSKIMFNIFVTPMVLLVGCVVLFIISWFCGMLGLSPIANLALNIGTIDLGLLIAYVFCRYSGNYPDIIKFIDFYSGVIYRSVTSTPVSTPTSSFLAQPLPVLTACARHCISGQGKCVIHFSKNKMCSFCHFTRMQELIDNANRQNNNLNPRLRLWNTCD